MTSPRVDVVIPLFNKRDYVVAAIQSVLAQTVGDLHVFVADDASTDGSPALVEEVFGSDPRVTLIHKEHSGECATRNAAISRGQAEFVAFLDSDDLWAPGKLEAQLKLLENPDIGAVYCGYDVIDSEGRPQDVQPVVPRLRGNIFRDLLAGNYVSGSASAVVVRRRLLEQAGPFDPSLKYGGDWEMWLRLAQITQFDYVPTSLLSIRRHPQQSQAGILSQTRRRQSHATIQIYSRFLDEVPHCPAAISSLRSSVLAPALAPDLTLRERLSALAEFQRLLATSCGPDIARLVRGSAKLRLRMYCAILLLSVLRLVTGEDICKQMRIRQRLGRLWSPGS